MSQDFFQVRGINLVVAFLVILFAISSWVDINGLWVELPILTQRLPEGWNLPSYMAVILQAANIAPLLYTIVQTAFPQRNIEVPVIYTIIIVGAVSCLLLVFFWDATAIVGGEMHSIGLLVLQFFLALVDCTSSVAYLPFMGTFKVQYMTIFYIGEGFSGMLPSLLSLVQGVGKIHCFNESVTHYHNTSTSSSFKSLLTAYPVYETPKFSVEIFFMFLCAILVLSCFSFSLLNLWSYAKKERVTWDAELEPNSHLRMHLMPFKPSCSTDAASENDQKQNGLLSDPCNAYRRKPAEVNASLQVAFSMETDRDKSDELTDIVDDTLQRIPGEITSWQTGRWEYFALLLLTAWLNGLSNGILPSLQSYSCLPYSIKTYHLTVTLSSIANPVACFITFFHQSRTLRSISILSALGCLLATYIIYTAVASPYPPFSHQAAGPFTIILVWILVVLVLTYTKVNITSMLREEGKRALLWCGAFTQAGSLVGALIIFFLMNFSEIFQQVNPC